MRTIRVCPKNICEPVDEGPMDHRFDRRRQSCAQRCEKRKNINKIRRRWKKTKTRWPHMANKHLPGGGLNNKYFRPYFVAGEIFSRLVRFVYCGANVTRRVRQTSSSQTSQGAFAKHPKPARILHWFIERSIHPAGENTDRPVANREHYYLRALLLSTRCRVYCWLCTLYHAFITSALHSGDWMIASTIVTTGCCYEVRMRPANYAIY